MAGFDDKLISRVGAKKKNILIWSAIGLVVGGFILSIYSGIDMSGAIAAANKKPEDLPEITDMEGKNEKQESWAIDMENRINSLQEEQRVENQRVADETKQQIIEANKFMISDMQRDNKNIINRIEEIAQNQARMQKDGYGNSANVGKNSFGIPLPRGSRIPRDDSGVQLPSLIPIKENYNGMAMRNQGNQSSQASANSHNGTNEDDMLGQMNIIPGRQGQFQQPQQNNNQQTAKKRQLFYSKGYANVFSDENVSKKGEREQKGEGVNPTFEVVTGFTDAYMVTGAYAPLLMGKSGGSSGGMGGSAGGVTGGGSSGGVPAGSIGGQRNVPVLLEAQGDAIFPNSTVGSIDKCMLIGTAAGNASSATIDIRLDKMTCVLAGGKKVIDGRITGWVVSEVGTPGIPATMIYRAGNYISRVIASGVLEGLSRGFINAAGGSGINNSTFPGYVYNGAVGGAGTGASNAFSKLADFYLSLAEATLPTLEAKGGRNVSIILSGGDKFTARNINLLDTREVDKYLNKFIEGGKK